ncbi:MAG: hypothetical protein ACYDEH_00135 [Acidimicrobiales bacterium]
MSTLAGPAEAIRRGLARLDEAAVLEVVSSLDLRPSTKISPAVGMPLRGLQQRGDVSSFAASAPLIAVRSLLELLVAGSLDQIIELLGEHSERPTYDQMAAAVDAMRADGTDDAQLAALLAFAIGEQFPAGEHCRRLIEERPEFALPSVVVVESSGSLLSPKEVDPAIREARRLRREVAKSKKKVVAPPSRPVKPKSVVDVSTPAPPIDSTAAPLVVARRHVTLTPAEARLVDAGHARAGSVVSVEIPFDSIDPATPDVHAKQRPAVVVAASDSALLVRGIYSNQFANRQLFGPWRRLGLDHVSYISDERQVIDLPATPVVELARLTDEEWNSLW